MTRFTKVSAVICALVLAGAAQDAIAKGPGNQRGGKSGGFRNQLRSNLGRIFSFPGKVQKSTPGKQPSLGRVDSKDQGGPTDFNFKAEGQKYWNFCGYGYGAAYGSSSSDDFWYPGDSSHKKFSFVC